MKKMDLLFSVCAFALMMAIVLPALTAIRHGCCPPRPGILTLSNQKIILAAIGRYAEHTDGVVPANPPAPQDGATYKDIGVARPDGLTDERWEVHARSALLYLALMSQPESVRIINQLPRGAVVRSQQDEWAVFVDAFGKCMDYQSAGDNGGPLLISGGVDCRIGGDHAADDTRSDGR